MESLFDDYPELPLDECKSSVIVDFDIFLYNENLEEDDHKVSFPIIKVEQEPDLYVNVKEESTLKGYTSKESTPEESSPKESTPNLGNLLGEALWLNRELQKNFEAIINGFENTLEYNKFKQKELEREILILRKQLTKTEEVENNKTQKKPSLMISNFGAPYFKSKSVLDRFPPMNGDAEIAKKLNARPFMFPSRRLKMTDSEEASLREAVKVEVTRLTLELKIKPEEEKLETKFEIQKQLGRGTKTTELLLSNIKRKIEILGENERELFKNSAAHYLDLIRWDLIAFVVFPTKYEFTGEFLRLWWKNYLRPDLLTGEKSVEEKRTLRNLLAMVDLNVGVSWPEIAEELAIITKSRRKRSPFDCFSYYQRRLNFQNRIFGWSREEGAKLNTIFNRNVYVDSSRRLKIDWRRIRPHFPGRTIAQIWSHLKYESRIADGSSATRYAELRKQELARKAELEAKLKPRGRPVRAKVPLLDELQQLFRPVGIVKLRRQRILSLPGDGRRNGPVLAALCRLLGVQLDMNKLPKVEKDIWDPATIHAFCASGIETKDIDSYRVFLEMIAEFPVEHDAYCLQYMSGESPPPESLLPPSLHTLAGLRGLLLWSESVASEVGEKFIQLEKVEAAEDLYEATGVDIEELQIEEVFGDAEADKRLLFFMESIFGLTGDIAGVW